jgi:protein SCO1
VKLRSLLAAAAALILAVAAARGSQQPAHPIELTDQLGRHFTLADLRGRPLAVAFVSTHCSDVCPIIESQLSRAAKYERSVHGNLRVLAITLDPERDNHADLVRVARTFDADPEYWLIAGGQVAAVHRVMHAFGVVTARGPDGYADEHTTFVTLLDGNGRVSAVFLASSHLWQQLVSEGNR